MEPLFRSVGPNHWSSSRFTRGPWSPDHQHFGPPAALLGRAIARTAGGDGKRVARVTFEVLRPVPITDLRITTEVVRPGSRIDLVDATLTGPDEQEFARARGWRMRVAEVNVPVTPSEAPPLGAPGDGSRSPFFLDEDEPGYHLATDWRFHRGSFLEVGPAAAWCRLTTALVDDEEPSALERVLVAADSGNGISAVASPAEVLFVNTDLTVHLHRDPVGEWVGLDAQTSLEPTGTGLATSVLHDEQGPIGRALQTLFVDRAR